MREAFPTYYVATTFNDTSQPECFLQYWKRQDFDYDNDTEPLTVNCGQARPWEGESGVQLSDPGFDSSFVPSVGEKDYLWDSNQDRSCDVTVPQVGLTGRATELDFIRFWWELQQRGMSVDILAEILNLADPEDWVQEDTEPGWPDNLPAVRMQEAVELWDSLNAGDFADDWQDLADVYGVDR